jgi:hypothetical protein
MGQLMFDFGNAYKAVKSKQFNSTALFWSFIGGEERKKLYEVITREEAEESQSRIEDVVKRISQLRMDRPDAGLIGDEILNAAAMLIHGVRRARWRLDSSCENPADLAAHLRGIIGEHQRLWLARNRVGGLRDSARRLEARLADYGATGVSSAFG